MRGEVKGGWSGPQGPLRWRSGAEFSFLRLRSERVGLRFGFFGMQELESDGETSTYFPFPQADIRFWRGLFGYNLAATSRTWTDGWCGRCTLEITGSGRHESEHYTGSNQGGAGTFYGDRLPVGNFLMPDVALRIDWDKLAVIARVQHKFFLPDGAYSEAPGADLIARWRRWPRAHLFASAFAEYFVGANQLPSAHLLRALTGIILPSDGGDLYFFVGSSIGNRKGLPSYVEERTLEIGVRAAPF